MKPSIHECAVALLQAQVVTSFENTCRSAGGGSWESMKHMTMEELLTTFSANGIRFHHIPVSEDSVHEEAERMAGAVAFLKGGSES